MGNLVLFYFISLFYFKKCFNRESTHRQTLHIQKSEPILKSLEKWTIFSINIQNMIDFEIFS
jgi:hypothetical protein